MSLPLNPPPDSEGLLQPAPSSLEPIPEITYKAVPPAPVQGFPSWTGWDILAVLLFTVVCIFVFSLIALFVAKAAPAYRNMSFIDAASKLSTNAQILVSAQGAAYLFVLLFIFMLVKTRERESFAQGIRWNWPGLWVPAFLLGGVVLALVIDWLSRFLPIPKSLPMDNFFSDATSAYMMAAFGLTLAPLLEELFFRGLLYPLLRRATALAISIPLVGLACAAIVAAWVGHVWTPVLTILSILTIFALGAAIAGLFYPPLRRATGLVVAIVSTSLALAAIRAVWVGHAWTPILSILSILSIFVLGASTAELLYPPLRRATGLVISIASTALAFAAIHGAQLGYAWAPVLSIFVVGVVFTVVRERLNSVAASFLMHCGYNFTLFTMLWLASDHFRHLEKAAG